MSATTEQEGVIWTPEMQDRRKADRRGNGREFEANGRSLNISEFGRSYDRRKGNDRRKSITLTITGRAIDIEENA